MVAITFIKDIGRKEYTLPYKYKINSLKEINIKNRTYYFFDGIINIKNRDLNKIKMDKKSYKNILIYYIGCVTVKNPSYVKINRVNHLYLIIDKINGYIEENNGNKYLTPVSTDKSKDKLRKNYGIKSEILLDQ